MMIRMLYDFHHNQNAKKPGTVHATYLLGGTKRFEAPIASNGGPKKDGEDDYMQSSPFVSSSMPQPEDGTGESSVLSITLVREENLEGCDIQNEDQKLANSQQRCGLNMSMYLQYMFTVLDHTH